MKILKRHQLTSTDFKRICKKRQQSQKWIFDFCGWLNLRSLLLNVVPLCQDHSDGIWQRNHSTTQPFHILFSIWNRFGPFQLCNQHSHMESKMIMIFVKIHHMRLNRLRGHNFIYIWHSLLHFLKHPLLGQNQKFFLTRWQVVHSTNTICKIQQLKFFSRKNVL